MEMSKMNTTTEKKKSERFIFVSFLWLVFWHDCFTQDDVTHCFSFSPVLDQFPFQFEPRPSYFHQHHDLTSATNSKPTPFIGQFKKWRITQGWSSIEALQSIYISNLV